MTANIDRLAKLEQEVTDAQAARAETALSNLNLLRKLDKLELELLAARDALATIKEAGRCLGCRADLHDGAGTCAPCAASDALIYQTETATLREELATLKAKMTALQNYHDSAERVLLLEIRAKEAQHKRAFKAEAELARLQPYVQQHMPDKVV